MGRRYTPEELNIIYESVLDQVEEGVVISDDENRVLYINRAAEVIEGVDVRKSLNKRMEELYSPTEYTPSHSRHAIVLDTGIPANEYYNQYVVKTSHKIINAVERMFPVNIKNQTIAVYSLIKNLSVMKKSMEQSLELCTHFVEEKPKNGTKYTFGSILGNDIAFVETVSNAKNVAKNLTNVLIYGETGTGKELFAQSIHNYSVYQSGPFISVNCAAIPATLLESVFFGTVKGAYTGASNAAGLFEQAQNGTIFLDEINSMEMGLQAKILKVIENKTIRRIGSDKETDIQCRILCALNEDPLVCIEKGKLRRDLYYRLSSCILYIPPLRERKSDIPLYCNYFLQCFNREYNQNIRQIDDSLLAYFMTYQWPGNVRELKHVIESAYSVAEESIQILCLEHISRYYRSCFADVEIGWGGGVKTAFSEKDEEKSLKRKLDAYERQLLKHALEETKGNVTAAAAQLEITRQSLQHKIKKYGL